MLLGLALIVNAILLWPEVRIERVPVNDLSFHIAASQRLADSLSTGDSFLDPWVSQWALGFPLWHFYQPLPHMVAGLWLTMTSHFTSAPASFAVLYYLLMVVLPASTYFGARLFGLDPIAAGFASILIISVSEVGDLSRYGLSYGAYVRRGSGLYTQLMSYNLLMPALGLANYSLNTGRRRILAACLVAATALSHVVFGYAAIVSVAIMALVGPRGDRSRRVVRAASILIPAIVMLAWFVVPMLLASGEANRCRWDDVWKFDSWGANNILRTSALGAVLRRRPHAGNDAALLAVVVDACAVSLEKADAATAAGSDRRVALDFLRPHDVGIFHARAGTARAHFTSAGSSRYSNCLQCC